MTDDRNDLRDQRDLRDLRVLAHPLRLRLLSLLGGDAYSAAEAARELDDSQANISYHLRRLHEAGLVSVAEEVAIRGGRAKRYRHDPTSAESIGSGDGGVAALMGAMAAELVRRAALYEQGGVIAFTDAEFWVEPEASRAAEELVRAAGVLLADAARPAGSPGAVPVSATLAYFQLTAAR
ncbi:helix-turn-helix domain-containing protein [Leifsonia poae]|uniref:HTH arsR-type domain-containing protein n=1 Tax=Leifsonia poae TaxID=110933 RepID=A0A9W6H8H3_9MICO|nr:helix-turn-helix domain-containing protein [Leifsonia poae]GLJ75414.1 hypothetical protein GCM10017584_09880 [Leifsonia poae]